MHIHILGICGTFMGSLAVIAKEAGHRVTGCDANVYPPMSTQLQAQGVDLIEGFATDQTTLNPDLYIIGNVGTRGMPLIEEILNRQLPYKSGPQWLSETLLQKKWVIAVAGTHGKTTTTSMLAWILEYAGLNPGFLIGGIPQNFLVSARLTPSPFFVIEADEYDTAFFDKRSKFVHYRPRTAILNNLEYDHADIFPDLSAIETQFHHLMRTIPEQGRVIYNQQASLVRVLERGCWSEREILNDIAGWQAKNVDENFSMSIFDVCYQNQVLGRINWELTGQHNRSNALAALAAARHVGVPVEQGVAALAQFQNVKRRMEIRGKIKGITVYDDFAHHPTAIETTIAGLRARVGKQARILAVLEPRSNTMKLGVMRTALPQSLQQADQVYCYTYQLGWDAAETLQALGEKAHVFNNLDALVAAVKHNAQTGDHILVMSNGSFGEIHQKLLDVLA